MRFIMPMVPRRYVQPAPGAMPDAQAVAVMMKYDDLKENSAKP